MASKLSLKDIQKRVIPVTVNNPSSGFEITIHLQLPSISDWNNALLGIEFPTAPKLQRMKDGKKEDYQDYNDPDYLRKRNDAFEALAMRRVTQAIIGGADFEELEDMDLETAITWLNENADRSILIGLSQALNDLMNGTKGGVEAKKQAFRPDTLPSSGHEDMRKETLVNG